MRPVGDWPVALITMRVCRPLHAPRSCPDAHPSPAPILLPESDTPNRGVIRKIGARQLRFTRRRHHSRCARRGGLDLPVGQVTSLGKSVPALGRWLTVLGRGWLPGAVGFRLAGHGGRLGR